MSDRERWALVLQQHQIKPSYPRLRIYTYLVMSRTHPTADEIYMALIHDMPTLSKMTVYNTLKILVEKGLARLISIEEHEARYDANISLHGHFKCTACDRVYDFPISEHNVQVQGLDGFQITERDLFLRGICPECTQSSTAAIP
ncbi:MAG: transcriptional repressor [Eubacteriales bacterium]|nr:transcriptional repressor [Eubacteriales bacterium]